MQNKIYLKADCLDTYSLAFYNNSIPLIDEIKIINEGENDLKNIELEISSSPSFFTDFIKKIDILSSTRSKSLDTHLHLGLLHIRVSTCGGVIDSSTVVIALSNSVVSIFNKAFKSYHKAA